GVALSLPEVMLLSSLPDDWTLERLPPSGDRIKCPGWSVDKDEVRFGTSGGTLRLSLLSLLNGVEFRRESKERRALPLLIGGYCNEDAEEWCCILASLSGDIPLTKDDPRRLELL